MVGGWMDGWMDGGARVSLVSGYGRREGGGATKTQGSGDTRWPPGMMGTYYGCGPEGWGFFFVGAAAAAGSSERRPVLLLLLLLLLLPLSSRPGFVRCARNSKTVLRLSLGTWVSLGMDDDGWVMRYETTFAFAGIPGASS
ncbi:hypothetical protein BT67DRAFT_240790 [Trichocladium antarcticum]|uniref:Uncharacterized protein n=1 Tax=Trichocladium antarcticum TaxID=1450529 RepID=A0AAN6UBZ3_9PEZI|nr:hypothetical protein BT67DRAFT_240790 [Trichocladium antarcticum]